MEDDGLEDTQNIRKVSVEEELVCWFAVTVCKHGTVKWYYIIDFTHPPPPPDHGRCVLH